ncbi:MAG: glutamine-hydrolyzing carbamoyl-phosphate synthase small subunit [Candidatus Kuenenia stuttgartiensis]|uniref:Carbamoyl phosphate synthase small chain n=1 Tax=Kuenenia stuttgartiensis TaxID=174633 RepID=A0A2C9CBV6_KUEST|nr:glutamine-hydrolyzing carbamoyl-phosphate synthase small subunit [Candidatus Kuenenia stuttgartiensis]MBZ0191639.1 glutamine-hydrolyzing carbamoyl-phosphate synthase small subunit [Candidatus Kuenenia stuttgartiensis]MCL4726064.1 glutamine-hydrolyzing carbamoyl-phosphate synthase small subunit [Candidatus Kuenenia stuttgartiensis]GJQ49189.1 MAG: carbamoyl-phosphate synthase small chain [Candidatus Kuenenia stuttgartiensis]SOH03170.1 strongly similar to carbamoyl-phosphate synthase small chai
MNEKKAILVLEDGTCFNGCSLGAAGETIGELVFNTSMMGYQEILTDPSYAGQIVALTYPLIGNYGINEEDVESYKLFLEGFIVKECSPFSSNWRSKIDLSEFLVKKGIVGIQGIDTRALTCQIRDFGSQQGIISTIDFDRTRLQEKAKSAPGLTGRDLVAKVTCEKPYDWVNKKGTPHLSRKYKVIVYDCGVKYSILRKLAHAGCSVHVVPAKTSFETVLEMNPDGIVLSNGPGDPSVVSYMIENIKGLLGKRPIFGICLGHQLLALALGLKTSKLKFGHHGGNQPVMDLSTKKVEITAQNHCFAVEIPSQGMLHKSTYGDVEITHLNLNDKSVEGLKCHSVPAFSVQYHPEASPGPHDADYLFDRFLQTMKS